MNIIDKIRANNKVVRAAVYARFSSDNQRNESIDAQIRAIKQYADKNDIHIVAQYIDKAKSATTDNRPEFLRMITEAESGLFNVVLVHKLDRFARNRQDSIGYRMQLKRHGVALVSILEYIDDSPESVILESVLEAIAEYYSKNLAREVNKGLKENALKALHTGGLPPLGYDVDKSTKKLVINEYEAEAVKLMFKMITEGQGYAAIIEELNNRGYKTKTGRIFGKNSIHDILSNEKYMGTYVFNKRSSKNADGKRNNHLYKSPKETIRIENAVPVIIQKEVFKQVQEKMAQRKIARSSNSAKEIYLLSGKIFCGECGYTMCGNRKHSGKYKTLQVTYRCSGRKNKYICKNKDIRREYIEAFVLEKLSEYVFDESIIPKIVATTRDYMLETNAEYIKKKEVIKKRISKLSKEISNLVMLVAKVPSEEMAAKIPELEHERTRLEFECEQTCDEYDLPDITEESIRERFELARSLLKTGKLQTTKKLIELFVEKVIVYMDHVEVLFNFHPDLKLPEALINKKILKASVTGVEIKTDLQKSTTIDKKSIVSGCGKICLISTTNIQYLYNGNTGTLKKAPYGAIF